MSAGILGQVSFALESSWGTAVTPTKSIAVQPGDGMQTDMQIQFRPGIKAQLAQNAHAFKGAAMHEGEYEMDFIPGVMGYLLKSALGSVSSQAKSDPNTSVYDHTFSESATKPSLTVEQSTGEITRRFAGCIVHTLTFSCAKGDVLSLTAGLRGKANASDTKISGSYETIRPFNFADFSTFSVGGDALTEVQNFQLTYTNNHGMTHGIGTSNDPAFNYAKGSQVNGSMELYLDSTTATKYADYLAKTNEALSIACTGDTIGSSAKYGLSFDIPVVNYTVANNPVTDDYNLLQIEFEALPNSSGKLIEIVLTNLLTSYS